MRSRFIILTTAAISICNLAFSTPMQAGGAQLYSGPHPSPTPAIKEKPGKKDNSSKPSTAKPPTAKPATVKPTPAKPKEKAEEDKKEDAAPQKHPKQPRIHIPPPPPSKLTISMELAPLPGDQQPDITNITPLTPPGKVVAGFDTVSEKYPWREKIVTTIFWVGEQAGQNNPVPNTVSSWDSKWEEHFGGFDNPDAKARKKYIPAAFQPNRNPFYCALPYNDVLCRGVTKPEAASVIPWFKSTFTKPGESVCRDRWVAIRKDNRVCYAQWSDCGPFRTDHWQYVFGSERPKPNLNHGAGLDVSPAVRDFLGLSSTDVTDWKFVEFGDVPMGPWSRYGENNHFVIEQRKIPLPIASKE